MAKVAKMTPCTRATCRRAIRMTLLRSRTCQRFRNRNAVVQAFKCASCGPWETRRIRIAVSMTRFDLRRARTRVTRQARAPIFIGASLHDEKKD